MNAVKFKPYYCEFCHARIIPNELGVYLHDERYHYDLYAYKTSRETVHVLPKDRFDLRH